MPTQLASLDSLVHPHQIEVQEFSSYALVIDARSAEAYQEDHIPGAVSVPVATQRLHVTGAEGAALVACDTEMSVPYALAAHLGGLSVAASVLVYCDRGGLDSLVWADPLKALGYRVDVLGGGWGNYRRWVDAGLEVLPRALTFRRLVAPPVGGLCPVLGRLAMLGEQVIDPTYLAGQRLIPGLTLDDDKTQASFDSALLDALRRFDPRSAVWITYGGDFGGGLSLPWALRDALQSAEAICIEVPLADRVEDWIARLRATGGDLQRLVQAHSAVSPSPSRRLVSRCESLVKRGLARDALSEILEVYIDPLFARIRPDIRAEVQCLRSLSRSDVARFVGQLLVRDA
jgi:tRNA 2-selenouridine synthase